MTDQLTVSPYERGVVRVFTADDESAITPETAAHRLGEGIDLDPSRVEIFPSSKIEPMSLTEYLHVGYGVPAKDLESDAPRLDALKGLVILVASPAFKGDAATLTPDDDIRFVGAYSEPGAEPPRRMAPADPTEETMQPRGAVVPPTDGRRPGGLFILAALILAAALLFVFVL